MALRRVHESHHELHAEEEEMNKFYYSHYSATIE